ncbi:MAG: hypothetical protein KF790_00715 [Steroidobacteraceae bacterium]|nr:hypothetical protein [Steroidobacteraceae bacterium]MCW5572077.1 hypothetical protein [Steroidobacteraceae bacterium]
MTKRRNSAAGHALRGIVPGLAVGFACVLVVACSPGGNVDIGSGQNPDPVAADFPMAYIKRTLPPVEDEVGLTELRDAVPDTDVDVYVRDRADPTAPEHNVTERITGDDRYDIRDLDVAYDGTSIVFAMRGPLAMNQDEEDPPTWNIWEYVFATDTLRRVIASDIIAEEGHDRAPHYLPDGRILFSSTRQRGSKAVLIDEGKPQFEAQTSSRNEPAFVLHVMNADGTNIRQVSYNTDHDLDPTVLMSGKIMWSRWDNPPGGRNGIHLYQANPDGSDLELLYGAQSHNTGTDNSRIEFVKARELPNGRLLVLIRPRGEASFGGNLQLIDAGTYVENSQPTLANVGLTGPAQQAATGNDVRTVPGISPGGRFHDAFPLWDGTNRMVVSWAQCLALLNGQSRPCTDDVVNDPAALPAPPQYSLWMYDLGARAFLPLMTPEAGRMITDVVIAQPRPRPAVILDKTAGVDADPDLVAEGAGILDITSIYDFDGVDRAAPPGGGGIRGMADPARTTAEQRLARFIRIEKMVSIPDDDVRDIDNAAFGATNYMREILAYAPIEPDGSVRIKVPANVAFQMAILDVNGRRLPGFPRHNNWLQLRPGEVRNCSGCHTRDAQNPTSHGRAGLFGVSYTGAQTTGTPFPNTVATWPPEAGETMAQTRARVSSACTDSPNCASINPSVNVVYQDVWTDPNVRAPDPDVAYNYAGLLTPAPTTPECQTRWTPTCRIVINYERHIHPLWSLPREVTDPDTMLVVADHTCTQAGCHNTTDANALPMVPAGNLDLQDGDSQDEPEQFAAYRELLFGDNEQCLDPDTGAVIDCQQEIGIDPVSGLPITAPIPYPPSLSAGNARGSTRFFGRFAAGGTHAGYLSPAELRLISEWVDIGAQYFNNPFDPDVPVN